MNIIGGYAAYRFAFQLAEKDGAVAVAELVMYLYNITNLSQATLSNGLFPNGYVFREFARSLTPGLRRYCLPLLLLCFSRGTRNSIGADPSIPESLF